MINVENIYRAKIRLKDIVEPTPLTYNHNLSEKYQCNILLKREDLQVVRSYKIRGAYNKMAQLDPEQLKNGITCASAGNHAQGVAFACHQMRVHGHIFMPAVTPQQKISKVKSFGKSYVEVILHGDTFDDAYHQATLFTEKEGKTFIHPFDDEKIIEGQGTVGLEILEACNKTIDFVFAGVGGGGLISGLGSCFRQISPNTKIIGVEPEGAPAMYASLRAGKVVGLDAIDSFVDGAAVKKVGALTFALSQEVVDDMLLVNEGKVCSTILQLYNEEGIVVEPAGALAIGALDQYREQIRGKTVVCVVSGSNNDITRTEEIKERSLLFEGLKHYFIIKFPQRPGALKEFLTHVLGPQDDITHFEYTKKHNRELGPAIIGILLQDPADYAPLIKRMQEHNINFQTVNDQELLFGLLI